MVLLNQGKLLQLWVHQELGRLVYIIFPLIYQLIGLLNIISCRIPPKGKLHNVSGSVLIINYF